MEKMTVFSFKGKFGQIWIEMLFWTKLGFKMIAFSIVKNSKNSENFWEILGNFSKKKLPDIKLHISKIFENFLIKMQ